MKNIILVMIFTLVALTSFSPFRAIFNQPLDPGTQIAHKLCQEISNRFKEKYNFKFSGIMEEGPEGKYKAIGLFFNCPRILTKEEGRELLLKCGKEMLDVFNSHPEFEQYMDNIPFTYDNITISIFVHPPENFDVYSPNISIFTLLCKTLEYQKKEYNGEFLRYSSEKESLEEAMKIIEQSKLAKEKNEEPDSRKD